MTYSEEKTKDGAIVLRCENKFCIYWKEYECTLDEIELDELGCCQMCIYVEVDEDILEKSRQEILRRSR